MTSEKFRGFDSPNYTPVPDQFFDELLADLSEAEIRVLLYLFRRTLGFKKRADAVSLNQLVDGIKDLDKGTGMHRSSVIRGCKGLVDKGIITVVRARTKAGDKATNVYALRFADEVVAQSDHPSSRVVAQSDYPSGAKRSPVGAQSDLQETASQETVRQKTELDQNVALDHKPFTPKRAWPKKKPMSTEEWIALNRRAEQRRER